MRERDTKLNKYTEKDTKGDRERGDIFQSLLSPSLAELLKHRQMEE